MDELNAIIAQVNEADPAFAQPWEADAFVIAVALSQRGYFSWPQWVEQFAQEIRDFPQRSDESAHTAYYRQWLSCLEKILSQHHLIPMSELLIREEQWRQAFLNTPHGSPVDLAAASCPPDHPHDHGHHHHHHDHHHHDHHDSQPLIQPLRVFAAVG